MNVAIFIEDKYGPGFLRKVISRLRDESYIKNTIKFARETHSLIKRCHNVGSKVKSVVRDVDKVIIVIDKENSREYDENREIWRHLEELSKIDKKKIVVIATDPCIEEWICISLNLNFDRDGYDIERKPDRVLKKEKGYRKSQLPKYADLLDFEKLLKKSSSFKKFYENFLR